MSDGASPLVLARGIARTFRGWLIAAGCIVVVLGGVALGANRPSDPSLSNVIDSTAATGDNAGDLTFVEARIGVGARCLRVLVADNDSKRQQGLAGRPTLPYDGMLFVYDHDVHFDFTMSRTLIPLDGVFYDARGHRVDLLHMVPCPTKGPAACTRYHSRKKYRYVLETGAGQSSSGSLGACPS